MTNTSLVDQLCSSRSIHGLHLNVVCYIVNSFVIPVLGIDHAKRSLARNVSASLVYGLQLSANLNSRYDKG